MPLPLPRRAHTAILAALLCVACGNPTAPDAPLIVRLTLSPPAIQATPDGDGWRATWTVNLDAASEFPSDSHGVLLEIAAPPASVAQVRAEVRGSGGSLLAEFTTTAAAVGAANGGSTALAADGPAIQVTQEASYATATASPSQSQLTVVATLRDARGVERTLASTSVVAEATCGGRGLPPCEAD